jgi:tetratricopeptide (TPR) repeat protein
MRRKKTTEALRRQAHEEVPPESDLETEQAASVMSRIGPTMTSAGTIAATLLLIGALALLFHHMTQNSEANSALGVARSLMRQGNYKLARQQLEPLVKKGTRDAGVFGALGECAMKFNETPAAIKNYTEAIRVDPKDPAYLTGRAQSYIGDGRAEEALRDADAALALNGNFADALRVRALAYARQFDYQNSLEDCDEYLKKVSQPTADVYATRALAMFHLKRFPEAVQDYSQAARMDPENGDYVAGKAEALKEAQQYREAIAAVDKAINVLGRRIELLRLRGDCYALNNDLDNAVKDYEAVASISPRKENYVRCADTAMKGNQFNLATYYYGKALELDPRDGRIRTFRELAKKNVASKTIVIDTGSQASSTLSSGFLSKASPAQLVQAGIRYMGSGYYQDAASLFSAALRKQPKNVEARRQLTQCFLQLGHRAEAKYQIRTLVSMKALSPGDAMIFARSLMASNDPAEVPYFITPVLRSYKRDFNLRATLIQALLASRQHGVAAQVAAEGIALAGRESEKAMMTEYLRTAQLGPTGRSK